MIISLPALKSLIVSTARKRSSLKASRSSYQWDPSQPTGAAGIRSQTITSVSHSGAPLTTLFENPSTAALPLEGVINDEGGLLAGDVIGDEESRGADGHAVSGKRRPSGVVLTQEVIVCSQPGDLVIQRDIDADVPSSPVR